MSPQPTIDESTPHHASHNQSLGRSSLTRRRVVQAAAWSVPTVSLAAAAPAFATTPPTAPPEFTSTPQVQWISEPPAEERADAWKMIGIQVPFTFAPAPTSPRTVFPTVSIQLPPVWLADSTPFGAVAFSPVQPATVEVLEPEASTGLVPLPTGRFTVRAGGPVVPGDGMFAILIGAEGAPNLAWDDPTPIQVRVTPPDESSFQEFTPLSYAEFIASQGVQRRAAPSPIDSLMEQFRASRRQ